MGAGCDVETFIPVEIAVLTVSDSRSEETDTSGRLLAERLQADGHQLFRSLSYPEIKAATVQSRVLAGIANATFIFCVPGSTNACRLAWDGLLKEQLDSRTGPCNFVQLFPRLKRD